MLALDAASTGRRGPGQAGSSRTFPGESGSRAAGFGTGMAWDVTPGCAQLAYALGESRAQAGWLLTTAWHLATRLGATLGALAGGIITRAKAELIVRLTQYLSDGEAAAVEAAVLGRAGRPTPGGLRSALARAVMEAAPGKARQRREAAARTARVERWAEDSGNAALMGRELPPDEVLACDQRIRSWAGELRKAGLEGGMDELRARAFLDLVLGKDSRPRQDGTGTPAASPRPGRRGRRQSEDDLVRGRDGPPDGHGTWRLRTPRPGPDWIVAIDTLDTRNCQHRHESRGHDPGVRLRHLSQIRHATCTSPVCRRPAWNCDFEHNTPYQAGGRTCLCNGGPKCKR